VFVNSMVHCVYITMREDVLQLGRIILPDFLYDADVRFLIYLNVLTVLWTVFTRNLFVSAPGH